MHTEATPPLNPEAEPYWGVMIILPEISIFPQRESPDFVNQSHGFPDANYRPALRKPLLEGGSLAQAS
jgi:hypothetical protein